MRHSTVIQMSVQRLACTGCGAEAHASCNCGKPYLPAKERRGLAAKELADNPARSDREIGRLTGLDKNTVAAVRDGLESTGEIHQLTDREGGDGKVRRLPVRNETHDEDNEEYEDPNSARTAFRLRADQAEMLAGKPYTGRVDEQVYVAARRAAAAWQGVALLLQQRLGKGD